MNPRRPIDPQTMFEITLEHMERYAKENRAIARDLERVIWNWMFLIFLMLVIIAVGVWF